MPAGLGIIAAPPKAGKSLLDPGLAARRRDRRAGARQRSRSARPATCCTSRSRTATGGSRPGAASSSPSGEPIPDRLRYILAVPPGQVLAVLRRRARQRYPDTRLIVLDTLGRIMPLPLQGETTYQRDYRVAVALKRIADERPGLTIVVIHHTRKAFADDFIDSISGTHGLAGAADTIIMLSRSRGKGEGILRVTGRDVIEADYAVTFSDGAWSLDGDDARGGTRQRPAPRRDRRARRAGRPRSSSSSAGGHRALRPQDIEAKFGADGTRYVRRLAKSGRLTRPKRGLYVYPCPNRPKCPNRRSAAQKIRTLANCRCPKCPNHPPKETTDDIHYCRRERSRHHCSRRPVVHPVGGQGDGPRGRGRARLRGMAG